MSKLTAVAYYCGIPPGNKNPEKPLILDNFCQGVKACGDIAVAHRSMNVIPCDVALIQGFVHENGKTSPHLQLRKDAINLQKNNNKKSLIVDSNLFLYADPGNKKSFLRYSFDGVFPTTGFYFDTRIDPTRWKKISQSLGIDLKPWRQNGDHILICLQRNGGWSMGGYDVVNWLNHTIHLIKKYTDRKIIVRAHPGDKKIHSVLKLNYKNVFLSNSEKLTDDLKNAWATVVYNSSPSVASALEGIPVFITDPKFENSQASEVSNTNLALLENPSLPDRQSWIEKISMCHWNFEEMRSGEAWDFMRSFINK